MQLPSLGRIVTLSYFYSYNRQCGKNVERLIELQLHEDISFQRAFSVEVLSHRSGRFGYMGQAGPHVTSIMHCKGFFLILCFFPIEESIRISFLWYDNYTTPFIGEKCNMIINYTFNCSIWVVLYFMEFESVAEKFY